MDSSGVDKRLQERALRRHEVSREDLSKSHSKLPDGAESLRVPSDEDLEKLDEELRTESRVRAERIEKAVERYRRQQEFETDEDELPVPDPEFEEEI